MCAANALARIISELARLWRSHHGSTTTVVSIALPVMIFLAAGATQYAVLIMTKERLQSAADAAALGAAKQLNLNNPYSTSVTSAAVAIAHAELPRSSGATDAINAVLVDSNTGVDVTIVRTVPSFFGALLDPSIFNVSAHARAHAYGGPPLCALALDPGVQGAITLDTSAVVDARACEVYSDSKDPLSINADQSAILKAAYTCAVGGKKGNFPNFEPQPKTGCPSVVDPLGAHPQPSAGLFCDKYNLIATASTTLYPGTYCGGLKATAGAVVTLQPGIYVISGGPLVVDGGASLNGTNVGFFLTKYLPGLPPLPKPAPGPGPKTSGPAPGTTIYFDANSTINLTAPKTGIMAGLLIFEDRNLPKDQLHQILSNNAQTLLETIYLPQGRLFVGSSAPVASNSAYTVVVSRTIELSAGPTLVLNSNYTSTDIPVPPGVGPKNNRVTLTQ